MHTGYGYLRVSTVNQAEVGFSLDNQALAIKNYCKFNKIKLLKIFRDDGKSGRTTNRPEFQEMLKLIKQNQVNYVLVYRFDRFARNLADFSRIRKEFADLEVKLISVTEGEGSSVQGGMMAVLAEWESNTNSQRTKDALQEKYRSGWQPTPPVIGYRSVGGERERKFCEIDPHSGPIIKKLFELYSTGQYSMASLQDWLKDKNIISKNGTVISFSRINNILNNPFYYGLIRWNGQQKLGKHPPLIAKSLFDQCQYVLQKHRHFLLRERKYNFLLRGFVYCSCGMRLVGDVSTIRSNKRKAHYYHCQKRYSPDCKQKYIQAPHLEEMVQQKIKHMQFDENFLNELQEYGQSYIKASKKDNRGALQGLYNQRTGLEGKRSRLEDLVCDGTIDKETYQRKHQEVGEQIDRLTTQIEELDSSDQLDTTLVDQVVELSRTVFADYKKANYTLKRHFLRFFYESFIVENKDIVEVKATPICQALFNANMVRLSKGELPRQGSNLRHPR